MDIQHETLTRILCDVLPPVQADGAYLFGQTRDNQESVFSAARELINRRCTHKILIPDCTEKSGYPGVNAWKTALREFEIDVNMIEEVTVEPTDTLNTLIEAEKLVNWAQNQGYRNIFIVAAPFHQERAFMTVVSVAVKTRADLRLYSYPGDALPWDEQVVHSQGTVRATRAALIHGERERIDKYQAKGDLASYAQVLNYLEERDEAVKP